MTALAHELRGTIPDLAAQFAAARSSQRRNMAFGSYTGLTLDKPRPATTADGRFGTVHVMIDGLADAVAFQVLMRHGTVTALQSDSYGQDTRAIDFDTVGFEQVFTLDAQGRSIPFEPRPSADPAPTRSFPSAPRPAQQAEPIRQTLPTAAQRSAQRPVQTPQAAPPRRDPAFTFGPNGAVSTPPPIAPEARFGSSLTDMPDVAGMDDKTLLAGLWVVIAVFAFLLVTIFDVSWFFVLIPGIWIAQAIRRPNVLSAIRKGLAAWQASSQSARSSD
jgi:hypothetical protein